MKKFILSITLCASFISVAQNLETKIPSDAQAVISVNGNRLQELMSIAEFDDLNIAKTLFAEAHSDSAATITSLKGFGFDVSSKAYYFFQTTDSVSYHQFIVKLSDRTLFEKMLPKLDREKIEQKGGVNIMTDYSSVSAWNDKILIVTDVSNSYQYFNQNKSRFLKQAENEGESISSIRRRLSKEWAKDHALAILNNNNLKSIATNSSYTKRKDDKAIASFWINNYGDLIHDTMKQSLGYFFLGSEMDATKNGYGIDSVWGNFYLEDDNVRLTADMEINKGWIKTYKKMYKSKIGNEFFKYFNQDDMLAYSSVSFNMQGTLEEYPTIVSNVYGSMMPKYKEEMEVAADLTAVLLDEEAIGNLITGNMLFVLNDISEREVTYTSYEYDDDYNRKDTIKTKTETLPDFTVMIGSENKKLITKLISLGAKYELVNPQSNYFKFKKEKEIPFDMFFVVKNNIAFLTNSESRIQKIANDNVNSNAGKHKKMMQKNVSVIYADGKRLMGKTPDLGLRKDEAEMFNFAKDNVGEVYFTTSKIKGNKMHMELKMDTPIKHGNSLKFFLNFFEILVK